VYDYYNQQPITTTECRFESLSSLHYVALSLASVKLNE